MKKKKIYGLIFLSFVVFSLFFSLSLVSAQDFWERWYEGTMGKLDAKILIFILTAIIVLTILVYMGLGTGLSLLISIPTAFLLTAFVTPESIIGVFKSYEAVPLTIATILPLLLFFALTYLSVVKESRTLMTLQVVAWGIFFFYVLFKLFLFIVESTIGNIPVISTIVGFFFGSDFNVALPKWGTQEGAYFTIALIIQAVVAGIMTFANGHFMNWMVMHTAGVKKIVAEQKISDIITGMKGTEKIGQHLGGGRET